MPLFGPPNVKKMEAEHDVKGLIKALGYKKGWQIPTAAAAALGRIGDAAAVGPLVAKLKESAYRESEAAALALGKLRNADAVGPLIAALRDRGYPAVRGAAASALGQIGDTRAVMPLIAALESEQRDVCSTIASALGQIGAPAVVPLIAALQDRDKDVRQWAATSLWKTGWRPTKDQTGALYWIAKGNWDKCAAIGTPAIAPLMEALKLIDASVHDAAVAALGKIGAPAIEQLIATLSSRDADREVASALGQIGSARAIEPLIAALKDQSRDPWVRSAAASALGEIGDTRAVEPLIAALGDHDDFVRQQAAKALSTMYRREGVLDSPSKKLILSAKRDLDSRLGHGDQRDCYGHTDMQLGLRIEL